MPDRKNRMRSIDPPMLPAWAEDLTDSGKKKAAAEDPAALAKRLAAEAKAKLASNGTETENPADLAKRLAAEAKAKLAAKPKPAAKSPDTKKKRKKKSLADRAINPKALAAKLAAEAKADLEAKRRKNIAKIEKKEGSNPDAVSTLPAADPPPKKKKAPPKAKKPAAKKAKKRAAAPRAKKSLADRAQQTKKMSAADALAAAMAAESTAAPAPAAPAKKKKAPAPPAAEPVAPAPAPVQAAPPKTAPKTAAPKTTPAQAAAPKPVEAAAPEPVEAADPTALIGELLPGATVDKPVIVKNPLVFRALWQAHRARALHDKDYSKVATACVLLDAIDRIPAGLMAAARVTIEGKTWAVWVDSGRGTLLGVAAPAEIYLAGL